LKEIHSLLDIEIPADPKQLRQDFFSHLEKASKTNKLVLVIDALNQLQTGLEDISWLQQKLPPNVKLIISFKRGDEDAERLLNQLQTDQAIFSEVEPFNDLDDRRRLVDVYLEQYLKDLDEKHLEALINSPGARNPLYLKIVLSELRVFGVFEDLGRKIREDFGDTPVSAFQAVLHRLETDPTYTAFNPAQVVPLLFGLLAHARMGLGVEELTSIFVRELGLEKGPDSKQTAAAAIYHYLRQMRPFLARRDNRHDFFYESFMLAARERYVSKKGDNSFSKRTAKAWHQLLAGYFSDLPLLVKNQPHKRKVSELPYHQARGEMWSELKATLSNFKFLQAKLNVFDPWLLVDDFEEAYANGYLQKDLRLIQIAINLSSHALAHDSGQLWGQLRGRLLGYDDPIIDRLFSNWPQETYINPLFGLLQGPGGALLRTFSGHKYAISAIVANKDETILATGSGEPGCPQGEVKIWDLETGQLQTTFNQHKSSIIDVDLSKDGSIAVSVSGDGEAKVWDTRTGAERATLTSQTGKIIKAKLASESSHQIALIVTAESSGVISLWHLGETEPVASFRRHQSEITELSLTVDGEYSISGDTYGDIVIGDLSGRKVQSVCQGHTEKINAIAVSPIGNIAATASDDRTIRVWNIPNGECLHILEGHEDSVADLEISADGSKALSCSRDGTLRLWDLINGKELQRLEKEGHSANQVALVKSTQKAASITWGMSLQVWDLSSGQAAKEYQDHSGEILRILGLKESGWVATGGWDQFVKIWDLNALDIPRNRFIEKDFIGPLLPHPDGKHVISFSKSNALVLWNVRSGQVQFEIVGSGKAFAQASISKDGSTLVTGPSVWDLKGRKYTGKLVSQEEDIKAVAVTPNGRYAVTRGRNYLTAWDLATLKPIQSIRGIHDSGTPSYAITASGDILMVTNHATGESYLSHFSFQGAPLRLWELKGFPGLISDVKVTPDEKSIVAASGPYLLLWDFNQHKRIATLQGHEEVIAGLDITPDSKFVVSGSFDGAIKVWDLERAINIHTIFAHDQIIRNVQILPDGRHVVSSGGSEIAVWNIQSGKRIAGFNCTAEVHTLHITPKDNLILARDYSGQIYVLELIGLSPKHYGF
jgi:WD40 repeat protein